jgi:hypothetical protein
MVDGTNFPGFGPHLVVFPAGGRISFSVFNCAKLDRCQNAEARMRPTIVVIVAPRLDGCARLGQTEEYMLIEAFAA